MLMKNHKDTKDTKITKIFYSDLCVLCVFVVFLSSQPLTSFAYMNMWSGSYAGYCSAKSHEGYVAQAQIGDQPLPLFARWTHSDIGCVAMIPAEFVVCRALPHGAYRQ